MIVLAAYGWPRDDLGDDVEVEVVVPTMSVRARLLTPLTDEEWAAVQQHLDTLPKPEPVPEPPRVMRLHPRWG